MATVMLRADRASCKENSKGSKLIYKQPDKKSLFETSVSPNLIFSSTACLKRDCRRDGSLGKLDRNSFSDCSKVSI